MGRNIDIVLFKINCSYTKKGIIQLVKEIRNCSEIHIAINFSAPFSNRGMLVVTKGHFSPFTLVHTPIIVIPDKIQVDVLADILTEFINGRVSSHVKTIRLGRREIAILKGMIFEKSDDEISNLLSINKKTVSSHKDNIKKKISANSRIDIFYAFSIFPFKDSGLAENEDEIMPFPQQKTPNRRLVAYG
ncbi:LuxR C-terminal-related transcriptional regulator [Kosakonia sp. MUSA4]|uniref:LuxR C-terminal-related transcriptional regulator n=1 Tax=Kosakonia sp. MUSA4 TaxID=2067958 RepID=UPI0015988C85|nr:LuxR C-terminal-related transcriptional regulator [Kosakonia sp. MUSA4]QJT79674.1 helix-turn-helix transcriptional regulator [Kosakonia sp. MUSA4]